MSPFESGFAAIVLYLLGARVTYAYANWRHWSEEDAKVGALLWPATWALLGIIHTGKIWRVMVLSGWNTNAPEGEEKILFVKQFKTPRMMYGDALCYCEHEGKRHGRICEVCDCPEFQPVLCPHCGSLNITRSSSVVRRCGDCKVSWARWGRGSLHMVHCECEGPGICARHAAPKRGVEVPRYEIN